VAAEPSVEGCAVAEGRAVRRLAADRDALFFRAVDVCGGLVRARFAMLVLRALVRDPPVRAFADVRALAALRALAAPPVFDVFRPVRAGAALRAPLRFAAVFAPFVCFAFADPAFAERFFAAFAML
jgi:hypothetical protein